MGLLTPSGSLTLTINFIQSFRCLDGRTLSIQKVDDFLYLIDLEPVGIKNYIASYVLQGEKVAIIETGPSVSIENLLSGLEKLGVTTEEIEYVAVSHVHIDHAGGAGTLLHHLPNAKLLVHERGAPHLIDPEKLWMQTKKVLGKVADLYQAIKPVPKERIIAATNGTKINLGSTAKLEVLETLGHASHHLSFYESESNSVFPGDAAGIYLREFDVIVPTTPLPFHLETALASITRLAELKPKTLCYTHFGPAGDVTRRLETYKNRLRLWAEVILEEIETEDTPERIYQRILTKDPEIRAIEDFLQNHIMFRRGILMQNIEGFVGYFRKTLKRNTTS